MVSARLADGEVFDSAKLKNTVRFLIENDMRNVVIDLGNLEYLYSDTINAFIASNRHMLEVSGRIAILTEHPKVQDILKRAGLDNIMRIYRSEAEMIADSKEILRQTSSYRIEELQKISAHPPEPPPAPKTEFDEFKAEMGQRLGSKLDNNELPQYQLGVNQSAPAGFGPAQGNEPAEPGYPTFNPPTYPSQQPEQPAQGFPPNQPSPAYNFNNQAFGGMANTAPTFPGQGGKSHEAPPNFDFPTVQLPVGQFGNLANPAPNPPQGGNQIEPVPQDLPEMDEPADPRQRKSAQERMRSPNARKQLGRRVGGREFPAQEDDTGPEQPVYVEEKPIEQHSTGNDKFAALGNYSSPGFPPSGSNGLVEESRSPLKFIIIGLLVLLAAGLFFFMSGNDDSESEKSAITDAPAVPEKVVTPAPEATPEPGPGPVEPAAETPVPPPAMAETPPPPAVEPRAAVPRTPKPVVRKPRVETPAAEAPRPERTTPQVAASEGLQISSNPPGAEVLVNFSKKGNTPLNIVLANNSNKIIVRMPGYKRFETTLPKNHSENELQVELEKEESTEPPARAVAAKPTPEPERVRTPEPVEEKPAALPVARQPQRDPEPAVKPKSPASSAAAALPTPGDGPIGVIFLSSSPARADIVIDGKATGKKTPAKLELPSGQHRIEMSKSGQKATVDQVVNEGKNKALHLTLQ